LTLRPQLSYAIKKGIEDEFSLPTVGKGEKMGMLSWIERSFRKFRSKFIGRRKGMNTVRLTAKVKKAG
jgi:hypothetical protein